MTTAARTKSIGALDWAVSGVYALVLIFIAFSLVWIDPYLTITRDVSLLYASEVRTGALISDLLPVIGWLALWLVYGGLCLFALSTVLARWQTPRPTWVKANAWLLGLGAALTSVIVPHFYTGLSLILAAENAGIYDTSLPSVSFLLGLVISGPVFILISIVSWAIWGANRSSRTQSWEARET